MIEGVTGPMSASVRHQIDAETSAPLTLILLRFSNNTREPMLRRCRSTNKRKERMTRLYDNFSKDRLRYYEPRLNA